LDAIALAGDRAVTLAEGRSVPPIDLEVYALHLSAWLLAWAAVMVAFALLTRALGRTDRFVPLVVAANWSSPILAAMIAIPYLLFLAGVLPLAAFDWAAVGVGILALAFLYLAVRTALAVRAPFAVAALLVWLLVGGTITVLLDPTFAAAAAGAQ
jgi:hypothetical protein